jgi:hypothetical protein
MRLSSPLPSIPSAFRLRALERRDEPGVPTKEEALDLLRRISTDPGIRTIMEEHQ